jgi:hypothetical protein
LHDFSSAWARSSDPCPGRYQQREYRPAYAIPPVQEIGIRVVCVRMPRWIPTAAVSVLKVEAGGYCPVMVRS